LGRSGLEVSRIAFGTWQLGGDWGGFDEDTAIAAIRRARELGVNIFDTLARDAARLSGLSLRSPWHCCTAGGTPSRSATATTSHRPSPHPLNQPATGR
jgi:Aldo/keto reductase family